MNQRKRQTIAEQLEAIERHLADAEEYVALNVNVEGTAFLHFDDWRGKSGHPLWVKNFMMPSTLKRRARKEQALKKIDDKAKDMILSRRKRHRATCGCKMT